MCVRNSVVVVVQGQLTRPGRLLLARPINGWPGLHAAGPGHLIPPCLIVWLKFKVYVYTCDLLSPDYYYPHLRSTHLLSSPFA